MKDLCLQVSSAISKEAASHASASEKPRVHLASVSWMRDFELQFLPKSAGLNSLMQRCNHVPRSSSTFGWWVKKQQDCTQDGSLLLKIQFLCIPYSIQHTAYSIQQQTLNLNPSSEDDQIYAAYPSQCELVQRYTLIKTLYSTYCDP